MRKFLSSLSEARLKALASDFSIDITIWSGKRWELINFLVDLFKGYRITVTDSKARWPDLK